MFLGYITLISEIDIAYLWGKKLLAFIIQGNNNEPVGPLSVQRSPTCHLDLSCSAMLERTVKDKPV